jgi:hypothetical protein
MLDYYLLFLSGDSLQGRQFTLNASRLTLEEIYQSAGDASLL